MYADIALAGTDKYLLVSRSIDLKFLLVSNSVMLESNSVLYKGFY